MLVGAFMLVNACHATYQGAPSVQERTWPAYLGSARRAPRNGEALAADPQPVWRTQMGRGISGSPALGEDVLVVAQTDRQVALVARATGDVIWRRRLDNGLGAGPLLSDDRIYVAEQTNEARVYSLRLSDGRTLWAERAGEVQAPLLLEGDALYAASLSGFVTRFSAADGARLWRIRLAGGVRAAPAAAAGGIVIATLADSLYLLDPGSGAVRARQATRGTVVGAPAVADSLVVVGTADGSIEAYDAATLAPRWAHQLNEPVSGSVAAAGGAFFALTARGTLARIPAAGPAGMRHARLGIVSRAGPMPTPAGVYVVSVNGELALIDSTGARRWTTLVGGRVSEPPLVDSRTLIVTTRNGEIVVYR